MTTTIETNELAHLDAQVSQAEAQLAGTERELNRAARAGQHLDGYAQAVEQAQSQLDTLKGRRERARILSRLKEQEDRKASDARKVHEGAVKKNAQAIKRELSQLDDSAQDAAQSVRDAVQALRDAVTRVRLHSASVRGAAGRLEALGLPLRDEYATYDTGASIERGRAVVQNGGQGFNSLDAREIQLILKWVAARVDRAEFHGKDSGSAYLHGIDPAIRSRILGE